jgi:hypothetical protein
MGGRNGRALEDPSIGCFARRNFTGRPFQTGEGLQACSTRTVLYNKMKGGVDKATEQDMKIAKQTKLSFENNHILHLWRKIMLAA